MLIFNMETLIDYNEKNFITLIFVFFFLHLMFTLKILYFAGFSFLGNADQDFRYPVAVNLFDTK